MLTFPETVGTVNSFSSFATNGSTVWSTELKSRKKHQLWNKLCLNLPNEMFEISTVDLKCIWHKNFHWLVRKSFQNDEERCLFYCNSILGCRGSIQDFGLCKLEDLWRHKVDTFNEVKSQNVCQGSIALKKSIHCKFKWIQLNHRSLRKNYVTLWLHIIGGHWFLWSKMFVLSVFFSLLI